MTDITIDVSGPGAERAALHANRSTVSAAAAATSERLAAGHLNATAAAALTAPGVYATTAQGLAATAEGGTFWSSQPGKPTLYRRSGNAATAMTVLSGDDGVLLSTLGAVADAKTAIQVTMTAGSAVLVTAADNFEEGDVGKTIKVAGAGTGGAKLVTTIASVQSPTQVTLAAPATTATSGKGAAIGTDCGPALQAALNAVDAAGGGAVVIDGYYLLGSPVAADFRANDVRLAGFGEGGLLIAGASNADMISISGVAKLRIEGVNFVGTPGEPDDARRVLNLRQCELRIRDCGFFGLSNMTQPEAAVIYADTCDLGMSDNVFGGCAMASSLNGCVVDNVNWAGFSSERDRFLDYGTFREIYHSKTVISFCYAWIRGGAQFVQNSNAVGQSVFRITDSRFDEGHFRAILVETPVDSGKRVSRVHLDGVQINNTFLEGGSAIRIVRADHVRIDRAAIGWANQPRDGIALDQCGGVVIDSAVITTGAPGADTGSPDGLLAEQVDSLTLINSPSIRRLSLAAVGRISRIDNGMGGVVPLTKFGPVDDADFTAPPPVGTLGFDKLANRIYAKTQSGWLATPALVPGDTRPVLRNLTPATATVRPTNVVTKAGGGEEWNASANVAATVRGSFRMVVTLAGVRARAGVLPASKSIDAPIGPNDLLLGVLREGSQLWLVAGAGYLIAFPYQSDQLVELRYNAGAGRVTLLINGTQVDDRAAPASLSATLDHRFGAVLNTVGSAVELLSYTAN